MCATLYVWFPNRYERGGGQVKLSFGQVLFIQFVLHLPEWAGESALLLRVIPTSSPLFCLFSILKRVFPHVNCYFLEVVLRTPTLFPPWILCKEFKECTVKPVNSGHPRETEKVAIIERWLLFTGWQQFRFLHTCTCNMSKVCVLVYVEFAAAGHVRQVAAKTGLTVLGSLWIYKVTLTYNFTSVCWLWNARCNNNIP